MRLNIKQNKTIRNKNYIRIFNKKINSYINYPIYNLDLNNIPIKKLPDKLKYINGSLYISNTNISELPDDITINGNLWCWNTPLSKKYTEEELYDKYNIKGIIYGPKYKRK